MAQRPHLPPTLTSADQAPAFWRVGILWNISLSAQATAGEFTMMDQTMPQGSGAPPHIHERYDEGFFIIQGALEYTVGDDGQVLLAEDGAAVWIPRGTRHSFTVKSATARALNFYTPGGFDESISMLATPAPARTLPPADSGEADTRGLQTDPTGRTPTCGASRSCTRSQCPEPPRPASFIGSRFCLKRDYGSH